nr:hypothetical protein [Catalimonadaceae bacterium]
MNKIKPFTRNQGQCAALSLGLFLLISINANCQQIIWAKQYPLPKIDEIKCITQDHEGNIFSGGYTRRGEVMSSYVQSIVYKLNPDGDTLFSQTMGILGEVRTMAVDPTGTVRVFVRRDDFSPNVLNSHLLSMSTDGFIYKRDTIPTTLYATHSIIGKDSSWIICGFKDSNVNPNFRDMFFQRIQKDGTIDPLVTLNPNHPDCEANRVEQLPNGHYLVSGTVGSRIASYELDEWGLNPVFRQWYQTPNLSYVYEGVVGQAKGKNFVFGSNGSPAFAGLLDSLGTRIWMKKDTGTQIAPQAMSDGSILVGYSQRPKIPHHTFARYGADSSTIWFLNLEDSLSARGLQGYLMLKAYTFFDDQSAVVAATLVQGTVVPYTDEDPFFIKIANVG